jgi:protein-S-isoprenylcysteine O-methyltransferase Ste14
MHERSAPSPWWYRRRGSVIASIYGLGFFLGYLPLDGRASEPVFVTWNFLRPDRGGFAPAWCAVASALVAWFWRASGTAYLRRDVVFAADVQRDRLIVAGPFRYVRNPLYLGNVFLALSAAVLAPPLGFALILVGNAAFGAALAAEESRQMSDRYGATYAAFRAAVPAFVPRLTPATVPGTGSAEPAWRAALLGEGFCLALALALVPVALRGPAGFPVFWAIWIPTLALFWALGWWAGRRIAPAPP